MDDNEFIDVENRTVLMMTPDALGAYASAEERIQKAQSERRELLENASARNIPGWREPDGRRSDLLRRFPEEERAAIAQMYREELRQYADCNYRVGEALMEQGRIFEAVRKRVEGEDEPQMTFGI